MRIRAPAPPQSPSSALSEPTLNMRLSHTRWILPIPAAFVLQVVYGALFANGVFSALLNDPTLIKALGLFALSTSLGITAFGMLLHHASDSTVYSNVPRILALLGSIAIAAQTLMAYALHIASPLLIYFSAMIMGLGSGSIYVVSIIILQAWVPESPGAVTGLGLLLGGAGSLFAINAFQLASDTLGGPIPGMALTGFICSAVSSLAALFIDRPPKGWSPLAEAYHLDQQQNATQSDTCSVTLDDPVDIRQPHSSMPSYSGETQSLLPHKRSAPPPTPRLSTTDILADPAFSLVFISICAAVGPGFGFVIAFPRMINTLFAVDILPANQMLFWVTFTGVAGRIAIGLVIDFFASTDASRHGFNGTKRMNTALLALQAIAFATMPFCIRLGFTNIFNVAAALVYITLNGGAVVSACLARSMFSPQNSTLVFALLGIAIGIGRALFSLVIAACGQGHLVGAVSVFSARRIYEYDSFIHCSFLLTAAGLISSHFIKPSKAAYQSGANSTMFADL